MSAWFTITGRDAIEKFLWMINRGSTFVAHYHHSFKFQNSAKQCVNNKEMVPGLTHVKEKKEKQTNILTLLGLPINLSLIGTGKQWRSNNSKISFSNFDLNQAWLNKYCMFSVAQHCSYLRQTKQFDLLQTDKDYKPNILREISTPQKLLLLTDFLKYFLIIF